MFRRILASVVLVPLFAAANGVGNGGDICENRFTLIRNDIQSWILKGGAAGLSLPQGVDLATYSHNMLSNIEATKVSCTDKKLFIGNAEKTCANYRSSNGSLSVKCNSTRFMNTSESDQYVLVHHEYAGLSGLEVNKGEASDYRISNQISEYLQDQVIKKLVIKKPSKPSSAPPSDEVNSCVGKILTNEDVVKSIPPGFSEIKYFGAYQIYQRTRICNSLTGCQNWTAKEILKSGFYNAFLEGSMGDVTLSPNCLNCKNIKPGLPLDGSFIEKIDDKFKYTIYSDAPKKSCMNAMANKVEKLDNNGNYKEIWLIFSGKHSLERNKYNQFFDTIPQVLPMNCVKLYGSGNTEHFSWYNRVDLKSRTYSIKENTTEFGAGGGTMGTGILDSFGQSVYFSPDPQAVVKWNWGLTVVGDVMILETSSSTSESGLNGPWNLDCVGILFADSIKN